VIARWGLLGGAAALAVAGCGSAAPAARSGQQHSPAVSPGPAATTAQLATGAARREAAARYLAIARPANRRLDHDFDDGLEGEDRDDLAAARADLRDAAATERRFDRQLLRLPLAPATEAIVRILVSANESRARLTGAAARSASLASLHAFERRLDAANGPVEDAVSVIRAELGLPPPATS
jgi:hypothetical protein